MQKEGIYSVKVKGFIFTRNHKNIIGDGFTPAGDRYLITTTGERLEIPRSHIFIFSPERNILAERQAKEQFEKSGGQ